ncbi:MAG: molybdopterin-dependent oxidoreductase [Sphingobium sp.]
MAEEKYSYCRICPGLCGITVAVEAGQIVKVQGDRANPATRGYACIKGLQNGEWHHHPDRIVHPQKRNAEGRFDSITSEQALDEIAARIAAIVAEDGPGAIAMFQGTQAATNVLFYLMSASFMAALGSPSIFGTMTVDQSAKWIAEARIGKFASGRQSFKDADVWMLVGNNPAVSVSGAGSGVVHYDPVKQMRDAKARGLKLIVVDPCVSETAAMADIHLQLIPGQDAALFAGLIHVILREDWHDADFCADHVTQVDALRASVAPFTPDEASRRCGVPADLIEAAARLFAHEAQSGMTGSGTGPDMARNSNLSEHLIHVLNVICGRFPRAGETLQNPPVMRPRTPIHAEVIPPNRTWESGHHSRYGNYGTIMGQMMSAILADEILLEGKGRIRALLCAGSNPANALPDQKKAIRALQSLDLLVTAEPRWAETARLAHYVMAPALALERPDHTLFTEMYGLTDPYAQYTPALLDPPPGSDVVEDWYVYYALAQRLGLSLSLMGQPLDMANRPSSDDLLAILARHGPISYGEVRSHPHGKIYDVEPQVVLPARPEATGRLEVMPADVAADMAALAQAAPSDIGPGTGFTHHLVSRRIRETVNTLGREFTAVRRRMPYNPLALHPEDLAQLGLREHDRVRIVSEAETIEALVASDATVRRGSASMNHGWGGLPDDGDVTEVGVSTSRLVTTDAGIETINAMPRMTAIPIRIEPLAS